MTGKPEAIHTKYNRIVFLDAARGFLAILVVIGHLTPPEVIDQYLHSWLLSAFFVISGMLFYNNRSWRNDSISSLIRHKAKSILYPYFTFSVLCAIYELLRHGIIDAVRVVIYTSAFDGYLALYFFPTLFFAEILFFIIMKKLTPRQIWVALAVLVAATTAFCYFYSNKSDNILIRAAFHAAAIANRALLACIFVFIGYCFAYLKEKITVGKPIIIAAALLSLAVNIICFRYNNADFHYSIIGDPVLFYLNAVSGAFSFLIISKLFLENCRFLRFVGKNSLIIFSTHLNLGVVELSKLIVMGLLKKSYLLPELIIVMLVEAGIVYAVNRYLPFLTSHSCLEKKKHCRTGTQ